MAKRYGRNQKRQHRQEIERLAVELNGANRDNRILQNRVSTARNDAFQDFVAQGDRINFGLECISRELGRAMGPHFEPHVKKLIESNKEYRRTSEPILSFSMVEDPIDFRVMRIEGRIAPLHYCIQVSTF